MNDFDTALIKRHPQLNPLRRDIHLKQRDLRAQALLMAHPRSKAIMVCSRKQAHFTLNPTTDRTIMTWHYSDRLLCHILSGRNNMILLLRTLIKSWKLSTASYVQLGMYAIEDL